MIDDQSVCFQILYLRSNLRYIMCLLVGKRNMTLSSQNQVNNQGALFGRSYPTNGIVRDLFGSKQAVG